MTIDTLTRDGVTFHYRRDTHDALIIRQVWDDIEYAFQDIAPGAVVIDVGAHIGVYALWAATHGAGAVYAYEPEPENFALLRRNVDENAAGRTVRVYQQAVTGAAGDATLYRWQKSPGNTGSYSMLYGQGHAEAITVSGIPLAEAVAQAGGHVDVLKLDCEGAEYDALYATPNAVLACIGHIVMEWHKSYADAQALAAWLGAHGFEVLRNTPKCTERLDWGESYAYGKLMARRREG